MTIGEALVAWCLRVLAFLALIFSAVCAHAQQVAPVSTIPINVLDGQRFAGEFTPSDGSSGRPDEFIFSSNKFHSRECLGLGFEPGPYWVRMENGRLHFLARLTSEENGEMTYEGTVEGAKLDVRIHWIMPRWYWTMKRDFRFHGQSDASVASGGR